MAEKDRVCAYSKCTNIAIPYSAFCIECADLSQFTDDEREEQNRFLAERESPRVEVTIKERV